MQLSIIIVNYNVKYFLEQCLCSVIKAIKNIEAEIFVVDNNSTDGSKDFFKDRFPQVTFIWNDKNIGFSKANNIAVNKALGDYILFLNPDTILPEDCLEKCFLFFQTHIDAGAMGIKMLDGAGKFLKESKRSFPSPVTSFYKLSGLARVFPHSKTFAKYHLGNLTENKNHVVDVLAGAFMIIPKKITNAVGSFDENFFMYGEDIDLSYRIKKAGYKNYYFSGSIIIHFKGESTRKGGLNYVRLFYKAMSIFARKHYGEKAFLFNFFIQTAILIRAFFSALRRFIRWVGMPVIDAVIILSSFWITKTAWNFYVKKDVNYSPNLLLIAFPAFTILFLAASYFSGLYDNQFKQRRLNRSVLSAILVLLSIYALLPEDLRFSRGILVLGSLMAFILITVVRWLLIKWKVIESNMEEDEHRKTFIVGTEKEFADVNLIMQHAGMEERILGRVGVNGLDETNIIGNLDSLNNILVSYNVKEVIFCEGAVTFKKIIEVIASLQKKIRVKMYSSCATAIIGSDSKDLSGKYVAADKQIILSQPVSKRNKNFIDVAVSIFFIITFFIHLLTKKNVIAFYKNVFAVLLNNKTWVGYANGNANLPKLKKGVITTTGLPASLNTLPIQSLAASDKWYATDYDVWEDVKIIWEGYKYLDK